MGYDASVASGPFKIPPRSTTKGFITSDALDIAARHFVYKLYDASRGGAEAWHSVRVIGEVAATAGRAVERGWITVRDEGKGKAKEVYAALTDEGRAMARKGYR
jgi:hypothetical protein